MSFILQPWQLFMAILCGLVYRRQHRIIEFYQSQLESVLEIQGRRRILLTDDQRRLLAVKGEALGRKTVAASARQRNLPPTKKELCALGAFAGRSALTGEAMRATPSAEITIRRVS